MIRALISRLNGQLFSRLSASRRDLQVPINVSIELERRTGSLVSNSESLSIGGETKDLSDTGIAFYVDSIRLREHYLVGGDRVLSIKMDLPNGTVRMQVVGLRYEQTDHHSSSSKYLIGSKIVKMENPDREAYAEFLRLGNNAANGKIQRFQTGISN